MYTIGYSMPRPKPAGPRENFQFKMTSEETVRWQKILDQAKSRNHYIEKTDVNRILLGLDPPDDAVTEQDRRYFLRPTKQERAELLGGAALGKTHLKEVSPKRKRS